MNIEKLKQIEDLKSELSLMRQKNNELYKKNVGPTLVKMREELLVKVKSFVEENGFNVKEYSEGIEASYGESGDTKILIQKINNYTLAISMASSEDKILIIPTHKIVRKNYSPSLSNDEFENEIKKIKMDIQREKDEMPYFENPEFYYVDNRKPYEKINTPEQIISLLFK